MATILSIRPPQSLLLNNQRHPFPPSHLHATMVKPPPQKATTICSSSSLPTPYPTVAEDVSPPPPPSEGELSPEAQSVVPSSEDLQFRGCKTCGKEDIEKGCNGEGRIQGGIATVPGFGWWPIKAFRPCPGFVASGGRYRRRGQSMDEVVSGSGERNASTESTNTARSRITSTSSREHIRNLPRLHLPKHVKLQRITLEGRAFSMKSSLSVRSEGVERKEDTVGDSDAVIIVDHGSRRQESNLMLNEFVAMFKGRTGYRIVEPAHMELAEPSISDAFKLCVQQGANRVIVSPFFLFPGRHWYQDIPALAAEAAREHSGISYIVTAPLGLHELMVEVMNDRIKHCLGHVAGDADECNICVGTGKCRLH